MRIASRPHRLPVGLIALATASIASAALAAPPSGQNYKLIFADEFNGNSLDTFKWSEGYPWGSGRTHNHAGYNDISQVKISNGVLNLHAVGQRHPNAPATIYRDDFGTMSVDYTTGTITTQGKLNITHGYIEASMKLDGSIGAWPAFWMLGNGWPPEIDIMEFPRGGPSNNNNTAVFNYHYTNNNNANASYYKVDAGLPDLTASFNLFAVDWTSTYMRFYVNGSLRHQITDQAAIADAVNMYMILNNGVDGWSPTPSNPSAYDSPFLIDYVRVYQKNNNASTSTTWQGNTATANWDTSANWSQGAPRFQDLVPTFRNSTVGATTLNVSNSRAIGGIVFDSTTTAYTLNNGSLQIARTTGPALIDVPSTNTMAHLIASRLDLWTDTRVVNNSTQALSINSRVVGDRSLLKGGTGLLILGGFSPEFSGQTGFYGGTNSGDGGVIRINQSTALGTGVFNMPGTNNASQIVELGRDVIVSNHLTTGGRSQPIFLRNTVGTNSWLGDITISALGGGYAIDANSGKIVLGGTLSTSVVRESDRIFTLQGSAEGQILGTVTNGNTGTRVGLAKAGTGRWTLSNANTFTGGTTVAGGTLAIGHAAALGSGSVSVTDGTLDLLAGLPSAVVVPSLAISGAGKVELRNNGLVLNHAAGIAPTILTDVRSKLLEGAIVTSLSTTDPRWTVGYADAAAIGEYRGVTLDGSAVILQAALRGDTNLDGTVGFDDLLALAQNYGGSDKVWEQGDLNYDGETNFDDLLALAQNYGGNAVLDGFGLDGADGITSSFAADWALAQSLVPEPATLSGLIALTAIMGRRRVVNESPVTRRSKED